jgi:hypothetical protein
VKFPAVFEDKGMLGHGEAWVRRRCKKGSRSLNTHLDVSKLWAAFVTLDATQGLSLPRSLPKTHAGGNITAPSLRKSPFPAMNRLFLALLLAFAGLLTAPRSPAQSLGGASDLHFNGFVIYNEAGRLEKSGEIDQALTKYKEAASLYETIEKNYPTYEVETRMNRQRTIATAIARLEGNVSKNAAASQAAMELEKARITAQAQATAQANVQAMTPQAPLSGPVQDSSEIPSLDGLLRSWESKMRGKMLQLEADKKNLEIDLNKWGEWHDWAAGEMTRVGNENATLSKKAGALEQAILGMQNEVEAGRAAAGQLDALKQQKAAVEAEMAKNARQLAAAEKAAADATAKLKTTSESFAAVTQEKAKLDAAHEARRKMWNTNRVARQAEYAALTKELSTDKFDPREVIALRKKTRAKIDAGFDDVQATWLAFWDVLNPAQRKILIGYMRDQHAVQGKASAAASAERSAARAKQQAALDRAEARAAAQGGSTSSATTAPAGAVTSPK